MSLFDLARSLSEGIISQEQEPRYKESQLVLIKSSDKEAEALENPVGKIESVTKKGSDSFVYTLYLSKTKRLKNIKEDDLKPVKPDFAIGQKVAYLADGIIGNEGVVDAITYRYGDGEQFRYLVRFGDDTTVENLQLKDLVFYYDVPLKESYSASKNQAILQKTFSLAQHYAYTILNFPKGRFKIGSLNPDKDYLILPSHLALNGNETTFVISGTSYWFGLATGSQASEGLSEFTMRNLTFEAEDLVNGNHFMLMANHGDNWLIENNTFIMVHQSKSHLFDLGGVQNAVFQGNQFIGFAPNLTNVISLNDDVDLHGFYSEVIQLDASDDTGGWDAGLIKRIDPDYALHNATKQLSQNIIIRYNAFLPYKNEDGSIIAYSGTVGQHSSDTGYVEVINNYFESPLVLRYPESASNWVLQPIHFSPNSVTYIAGNQISR